MSRIKGWVRDKSKERKHVLRFWNGENFAQAIYIQKNPLYGGYQVVSVNFYPSYFEYDKLIGKKVYDSYKEAYKAATSFMRRYPEGKVL